MSTVNEVLNQAMKIKKALALEEIVCVFDQALYATAAEITWKHPENFSSIVLRMGVFHTICNLLGIIGKRFQDAGLRDLAIEAGVIAEGSIDSVMDGRKYNRGVRLHKLVYAALIRLVWKGFYEWFEEDQARESSLLLETQKQLDELHHTVTQESLNILLQHPCCTRILNVFHMYLENLRLEAGPIAHFWVSYIDMVEILLGLIRASREGDWMLHLYSIRAMLPWCFAYDKINYSRYLSVYYAEMTRLPDDHPDVHSQMRYGGLSVQLGDKTALVALVALFRKQSTKTLRLQGVPKVLV